MCSCALVARRAAVPIAFAVMALLAITASASAYTTVSKSSFNVIITLDTDSQDHLTVSVPTAGTIKVADTAGVRQDPNNEAICTGFGAAGDGSAYLECGGIASLAYVEVKSTVNKSTPRDVIDMSGSPARVFMWRVPTVDEIDVTGSAFNDRINGSPGADAIAGGGGNDQILAGTGADTISGGGGSDGIDYSDHGAGVNVTAGSGIGDDGNAQDGPPGARDTVLDADTIYGTAAADTLAGDGANNWLVGGEGNDTLTGGPGNDLLDGGGGSNTASYADHGVGAPVMVNLSDAGPDGAAGESDTLTSIQHIVGGSGGDTLVGDAGANEIHGGAGNDLLIGSTGVDRLFGETGNDDMRAKDAETDTVDCGPGADKALLDDIDLAQNCDDSTITVVDKDGDGAPAAQGVDCNDNDASIHPGATDVPGDGIDQDCAGGDARVDADRDGIFREQDCDDTNAAIKPGAIEIPGNAVDENCDGVVAPFPKLDAGISLDYAAFPGYTLITGLAVTRAPAGAAIVVRCRHGGRACPFKSRTVKLSKATRKVSFTKAFKRRRLPAGTIVRVTVSAPGTIGKVATYKMRRARKPSKRVACASPTGKTIAC